MQRYPEKGVLVAIGIAKMRKATTRPGLEPTIVYYQILCSATTPYTVVFSKNANCNILLWHLDLLDSNLIADGSSALFVPLS